MRNKRPQVCRTAAHAAGSGKLPVKQHVEVKNPFPHCVAPGAADVRRRIFAGNQLIVRLLTPAAAALPVARKGRRLRVSVWESVSFEPRILAQTWPANVQ